VKLEEELYLNPLKFRMTKNSRKKLKIVVDSCYEKEGKAILISIRGVEMNGLLL